ncbi:MAG TPA: FAD-dependent oxidoreductase [Trebonia sp.]|nr:FAD-dependent oxidoreductase [Trebonia sp.]
MKPTSKPSLAVPADITETPDLQGAYPRLSDAQIAALTSQGDRRATQPGKILFREGERDCDFYVVLAGHVASVEGHETNEERIFSVHGRGRFLGELSLLTGEGSFYTAMALDSGEALAVSVARLRELIVCDPAFGDLILRAYLLRRSILIGLGVGLRVVGSRYSPDTRRVRDFVARNRIPLRWLDLETDPAAEAMLAQFRVTPDDTPIVIVYGRLLRNPCNAELAAAIGLPAPSAQQAGCDVLVVGAGPAGLSAAMYAASEGMQVTALDGVATGGQAETSSRIENYLGFPSGISGAELADRAVLQAKKFGARFAVPAEATAIALDSGYYRVHLADRTSLTSTSVIIATGARYRRLDVPRLDYFEKMSVYYAASQAEALMCLGDPVAIVGGGNSAGQAAIFLSAHATRITLIVREHDLGEHMSRYLIDHVTRLPNVQVMVDSEVRELHGDHALEAITVADSRTGTRRVLPARALFVFIGAVPCTDWLGGLVDLDDHGFVRTGAGALTAAVSPDGPGPLPLETNRPAVFAVGDVRSGSAKRVAAAVGEGAMAIRLAFERARPA